MERNAGFTGGLCWCTYHYLCAVALLETNREGIIEVGLNVNVKEGIQIRSAESLTYKVSIPGLVTPVSGPSETSIPGNRKP